MAASERAGSAGQGPDKDPLSPIPNGRNGWLEGVRLARQHKREEKMGLYRKFRVNNLSREVTMRALTLLVALLMASPAVASDVEKQLLGVWRLDSFYTEFKSTGERKNDQGCRQGTAPGLRMKGNTEGGGSCDIPRGTRFSSA